jgi:hypothetical protein
MATSYFLYNNIGSFTNPLNYTQVSVQPTICVTPYQALCAIFASIQIISGQEKPIITSSLSSQISTAVSTLTPSPNVLLRPTV